MAESVQQKLNRVRKPRVHITYDVETEGAEVRKELPFVVGVIGDFSGKPYEPVKPLRDRKFTQVDRDNFDDVMQRMTPGAEFKVENTLAGDDSQLAVQLKFKSMDDFSPENVARQVKPLRELLELRSRMTDLRGNLQGNDKLEELLRTTVGDKDKMAQLRKEMNMPEGSNE